jgi:soluble lytic murein transglycosylase-like protein
MGLIRGALVTAAVAILAQAALPAAAAPLAALSDHDLSLYTAAFDAAERGDTAAADAAIAQVSDPCLAGKVRYLELTHARARTASYQELSDWLKSFGDMPGASQVYELALQRKPADALPPAPVATLVGAPDGTLHLAPSPQSHAARDAYFHGAPEQALEIARGSGDAWIAGLAAYRLGRYADAMVSFETLAANPSEDDAIRAAGGVWAAKAATMAGMPDRAAPLLKIAAEAAPSDFYGMIARRKLELADDPLGRMIDAATSVAALPVTVAAQGETALDRLIRTDNHARRAVALAQLARAIDAGAEMRAGFAEAADDTTRGLWMNLMFELGPHGGGGETALHPVVAMATAGQPSYPIPVLTPAGGFTVDKALVYAVAWQESRFNSLAVSPVGAVGVMQLMPTSAAYVSGDATLSSDPITLFDTGRNLAVGQAYLTYLEANAADHDILRTVAAYNAGPTPLKRTIAALGDGFDSLMVIETMPASETRAYVKKVMAAYWTYRRQFGAATRTLDAVASDLPTIDARLDGPIAPSSPPVENAQTASAPAREALEILLHKAG